jgi:hypothetical protein
MGAAETGTGKTGAFGIPILQLIHEHLTHHSTDPEDTAPSKPAAPVWRMSTEDRAARLNIDATGLTCAAIGAASWEGGRATCGVTAGRVTFEVECVEVAGTVRPVYLPVAAHTFGNRGMLPSRDLRGVIKVHRQNWHETLPISFVPCFFGCQQLKNASPLVSSATMPATLGT